MPKKSGNRFRLLIYGRMWQRWAWPCILIVLASSVLWWFAPRIWLLYPPFRPLALVPGLAALLLLAYTYVARRMAWVQCRANHLRIRTPFYSLAVSYSRIKAVRPNTFSQVFDPIREKNARRAWLYPYWGQTVLLVELSKYPLSRKWLRLWFDRYLLTPNTAGFVFLVDDWMTLSHQLQDFINEWELRRAARRQERMIGYIH